MGLFGRLMGRDLPERRDGRRIYFRLLEQARQPGFFGSGRFADDYDGRIDAISLHMAVLMERLRSEGEDGRLLTQAMFDEMKDDFEIALREEAIGDTGVKKRIKPMIGHFYDRLKTYTDALTGPDAVDVLAQSLRLTDTDDAHQDFARKIAAYAVQWSRDLKQTRLEDITSGRFYFPEL
ncbi:ubiquinol-cytochrome C chaperone family protein [uncultured Algimonas sp.]|uniref:ubiquinol-cytochrome C chaperone family protein n=1 Tax=uncultured Algimonas sp. TaxID=1547920 RepID=UPI00261AD509|nr:ubiquinol-cytochrome C chaperone family protein [uncultured Algimonas sp.]